MRFYLILVFTLYFSSVHAQHQEKSISINSSGSYVFQFGPHNSIQDVYSHWGYSLMFDKMKNRNGWALGLIYGQSGFKEADTGYPILSNRAGLNVYINYVRQLKRWKRVQLNAFAGLSTKYSEQTIILINGRPDSTGEAILDPNGFEFGGLATNIGINTKLQLLKRLFLNASVRSINFLALADYQTHSIYTEIGLGWRLGELNN